MPAPVSIAKEREPASARAASAAALLCSVVCITSKPVCVVGSDRNRLGQMINLLPASWRRRPLLPGRSRIRPMSGNTFGKLFCVTSFGESHGPAIGCVIDGCPPGLLLEAADIQRELDRRKPGTSRHVTQRRESDTVEILSGVFDGRTTGAPIALLIRNADARSKDYAAIAATFRPGHADYTYWQKYGIRDFRGGGRQSARETAVRVAAAAIARKWLREHYGVEIRGHMSPLRPIRIGFKTWESVEQNPFFSPDPDIVPQLEEFMDKLRKSGDSCGARITAIAKGVPVGWGEPVYDKLDADIAYA